MSDRYIDMELYLMLDVFLEKKFVPFAFHPFSPLNAKRSSFITIKISFLAFDCHFYSSVNKTLSFILFAVMPMAS